MPRTHLLRRTLLILGACWIALSTGWVVRRYWAVRTLEKREARGGVILAWQQPAWASATFGKWGKLLPTARITRVNIVLSIRDGRQLARAVRACGPIQQLILAPKSLAPIDNGEAAKFLLGLGQQSDLHALSLQALPLEHDTLDRDTLATLLRRIPRLRSLTLRNAWSYTGADFPQFESLETVDIRHTPFSDEGFATMLRCPALKSCTLVMTAVTPAAVLQLPERKQFALSHFVYMKRDLPNDDFLKLRVMAKNTDIDVKIHEEGEESALDSFDRRGYSLGSPAFGTGRGPAAKPGATPPPPPSALDRIPLLLGSGSMVLAAALLVLRALWPRKETPNA